MEWFRRFVLFTVSVALLGGAGTAFVAAPATATVTTLCTGYVGCAKVGLSDGGYAAASKTMWWRMYAGHNCTNYAAYRVVRSGLANTRPWTGSGNATNWGTAMSRITNSTPAVGSVAWWRAGVRPAGSSGHVAYVEKVVSADEIIVSQDSWGGDFSWARITRSGTGWPSGFIHFNDAALLNTEAPVVSGALKSGSTLTATPGRWSPAGARVSYQWLQDGVKLAGATGSTFKLAPEQVNRKVTVQVTASLLGYPTTSVISAPGVAVKPGVLSTTTPPEISGVPQVGETLSTSPGSWSPQPDQVRYQWRADGAALAGASAANLAVGPELVGKKLTVTVTALKTGYPSVETLSASTTPVTPGDLRLTDVPRVTGTPEPGQTLTLRQPGVVPQPALGVQWLRDGVAIPGATGLTYRVTSNDLGSRVTADVRLTRAGYSPLATRATTASPVRSRPVLRLTAKRAGTRTMSLSATVTAAGVPDVDGFLQVRTGRRLLATVPVTDGQAVATLTRLPRAKRTYRFRVLATESFSTTVTKRRMALR